VLAGLKETKIGICRFLRRVYSQSIICAGPRSPASLHLDVQIRFEEGLSREIGRPLMPNVNSLSARCSLRGRSELRRLLVFQVVWLRK
jgi:hypothetical protein